MKKLAAIYARVSTEKQDAENKVSIEMQLADCEAYCRERGYTIVARYVDNKKYKSRGKMAEPSGTRSDRPQFQAMLKASRGGCFDVVVAWKEDRLCRGIYAAAPLGKVLEDTSITIELVKEQFDPRMFFVKAAIGQMEVENIKERMRMGKRGKAERGFVVGNGVAPYGYAYESNDQCPGSLEVVEAEARAVQLIFQWYADSKSLHEVIKLLSQDETIPPPRRGRGWYKASLAVILSNELYVGTMYYNKTRVVNGKRVSLPKEEWIGIPVPAIVDQRVFEAVQQRMAYNREHRRRQPKYKYLLSGMLCCGEPGCGYAMFGITVKRPNGGLNSYYRCGACSRMEANHKIKYHRAGAVDAAVWGVVREILLSPEQLRLGIEARREEAQCRNAALFERLDYLQHELVKTQRRLDALLDKYIDPDSPIGKGEYRRKKEELERARLILQREATDLSDRLQEVDVTDEDLETIEEFCAKVAEGLEQATFEDKREILKLLRVQGLIYFDQKEGAYVVEVTGMFDGERVSSLSNPS